MSVISRSRGWSRAGAKGLKAIPEELQSIAAAEVLSLASDAAAALDTAPAQSNLATPPRDPATDRAASAALNG